MASVPVEVHRKRNTFTSYVAPLPDDLSGSGCTTSGSDEWCVPSDIRDVQLATPRLLSKEQVVASAPAYMYTSITPMQSDSDSEESDINREAAIFGLLSVTNFKLTFVPLKRESQQAQECYQEHMYLSRNDVTLNNIDHVYQFAAESRTLGGISGNKRKKLDSHEKVMTERISALHIVCKNFRFMNFAFQQSKGGKDYGKLIASALAMFAFRSKHDLSFAYFYREPYYNTLAGRTTLTMFNTKNDWARELIRCGATNWQVVSSESHPKLQNKLQAAKYTLPPNFVIPKSCDVERYLDLSRAFVDTRAAFWVYSYGGASLVRLAELKPDSQQDTKVENVMLELVRKCDIRLTLKLLQLTDRLPNVLDVRRAYLKFRRLCTPENPQQFVVHDSKFLSLLEKSNWLFYVSLCLRYSCEAAEALRQGTTCVLQESNGRDLCCVISSLTQIILDPLYRTLDGFQTLVQKEWIALEHPFQTRLGHVRVSPEDAEEKESPVFLLFLDCVWQLLQQYPEEFEFSQTYLTTLWDSCFLPIFDTFQFDTNAQRAKAVHENHLVLRPVWDWSEQFAEKDKVFFTNPFYQKQRFEPPTSRRSAIIPPGAVMLPGLAKIHQQQQQQRFTINPQMFETNSSIPKDRFLQPSHRMADLEIWEQCYFRWMSVLEIKNGGFAQVDLYHRVLLSNIARMQRCLELQDYDDLPDIYYEMTGEARPSPQEQEAIKSNKHDTLEVVDGVERRRKSFTTPAALPNGVVVTNGGGSGQMPEISSFFPFSVNTGETQQLLNILSSSNEFLLEGSIMDRLSMT